MRALTPLRPIAPAVDTVVKDGAAVMSPIGPDPRRCVLKEHDLAGTKATRVRAIAA